MSDSDSESLTPARVLRVLALVLISLFALVPAIWAQEVRAPKINKIDPPNWWVSLPDPMLLVHGENLGSASFTVQGTKVAITKTQVSENGHWAFLWLSTAGAKPQTINIVARSKNGQTKATFELGARKDAGPRGISTSDVIYELMPDRFARGVPAGPVEGERNKPRGWHGGNLQGVEQRLDYVQQLGATAIWMTPVYDNSPAPEGYHGYEATDLYAVDPHFGTFAGYKQLADSLHRRDMKILFDTVPNHIGKNHPWVLDPPTPDWFHGTLAKHTPAKGEFVPLVDPYSSRFERRDITEGWFANKLPDLNQESPLVSKYLIQNTIWWIESAGIDALRLDTFPYVGRAFWHDFHSQLHSVYPNLTTISETFNFDPRVTSYFVGGHTRESIDTGLDTVLDYPLAGAIRAVVNDGASMTKITDVLRQDWLYPHPERIVTFIGNHDIKRLLSNDSADPGQLRLAFGLLGTLRGIPQLYSGDEIGMRGGDDPDNRRDFPGGFPGDSKNGFDATQRSPEQQEMHSFVSALVKYRNAHPALRGGQQENLFIDDTSFVFARVADRNHGCKESVQDRLLVAVNKSEKPRELKIDIESTALQGCAMFEASLGTAAPTKADGATVTLTLAPRSLVVYHAQ